MEVTLRNKIAILTNDVETTSIWFNDLRDETGYKVWKEGMPLLLDIYRKYGITSTFYYTAYIAKLYPEVVKMILSDGHEVGSHGKSHIKANGFDVMPIKKQKEHLEYSKKLLEDISGQEVTSFRAPALRVSKFTATALLETGFNTDSSIASQRFDFFLSFGGKQKLKFFSAPRLPYRTSPDDIYSKGESNLIEVPLSATILPYTGTTMRIFPMMTRIQQRILDAETSITGKPHVFGIHPNEFINESMHERKIQRRSDGFMGYLMQDIIRGKLKIKNLGSDAVPIYTRLIDYYVSKQYRFQTIRDYALERFMP